jgi:hypothetical protein
MQTESLADNIAWFGRLCFLMSVAFVLRFFYQYRSCPSNYVERSATEWKIMHSLVDLPPHDVVVIEGPRLSGKTLLVEKVMADMRSHYIVVGCHGSKPQVEESIRKVASASNDGLAEVVLRGLLGARLAKAGDNRPADDVLRGFLGAPSARGPAPTLAVVMMDVVKVFVGWVRPRCAIILDNLDDGDAAKWLLETARSSDRKIIVTTQDAQVLRFCEALTHTDRVKRVGAMAPLEARDLALARLRGTEMLSTASLIRDNDTLPPKFVAAIDTICRDYCDYRPAFVSLVFANFAEIAGGSSEMEAWVIEEGQMEAWVRENFTLLVTTGPEQGSNMNVSIDVVHNARRESWPVTAQTVYDDILGALAAMGTTNCSDALLHRVCEDHGTLLAGQVVADMRRRWHVLRDDCDGQYYVHRLDLEGVKLKPILAAGFLLEQLAKDKKMIDDQGVRTEWQRALTTVLNNSAPNEKAIIVNLVRTLASRQLSRNTDQADGKFLDALRIDDGILLRTAFKEQSRATGGAKSQSSAVSSPLQLRCGDRLRYRHLA